MPMRRCAAIVAFLFFGAVKSMSQPSGIPLQIGVGIVDITGDSAVVLDPLYAKAIVFKQGAQQFALIECDLTAIPQTAFIPARKKAAAVLGTTINNIALAATHTHMAGRYSNIPAAVEKAVLLAKANMQTVHLRSGIAQQPHISFNRRYFMKDGSVVFNPMFLNPDIVRPAGGIDPEVGVVLFYGLDEKPVTALINFALHLDVVKEYGNRYQKTAAGSANAVSADYPFWLNKALQNDFGNSFQSIFLTGACGNINHWDFSKPGPQSGYKTKSKEIGDSLYESIRRALPVMQSETPSLAVRSRLVAVPLQSYTADDLAWAKSVDDKTLSQKSEEPNERQAFLNSVKRRRILALDEQRRSGGATLQLEVQAVRLSNNTAIITLPGEIFVELGQTIKNHSPFANTLIVELANNNVAYVPNKKAFVQGGYEVENSRLAPGGGELLVEAAIELLKELKTN